MEGDVTSYPLDSAITSMVGLFSSLHLLAGCQGGGEGEGLMWHDAENLEVVVALDRRKLDWTG